MVGANEKVVCLGVSPLAVEFDRVVRHIVLMSDLPCMIGKRPVEKSVDPPDKFSVIVNGIVTICRTHHIPIHPVHSARVAMDAIENFHPIRQRLKSGYLGLVQQPAPSSDLSLSYLIFVSEYALANFGVKPLRLTVPGNALDKG